MSIIPYRKIGKSSTQKSASNKRLRRGGLEPLLPLKVVFTPNTQIMY